MLFSVPVSSLQIWGRDGQWRYVPYKAGALVINIGETLECECLSMYFVHLFGRTDPSQWSLEVTSALPDTVSLTRRPTR
jgi:hypothetical protein